MNATPNFRTFDAYGWSPPSRQCVRSGYSGETREPDTGWYILGNRPYSPALRRFLAADPRSPFEKGGVNRYAYTSGDPINRTDPSGEAWTDWLLGALAIVASVAATVFSAGTLAPMIAPAIAGATAATSTGVAAAATTAVGVATGTAALTADAVAVTSFAASMPALAGAATAVVADTVSVVASVGSLVTAAAEDIKGNEIFGWMSVTAGMASAAGSLAAAKVTGAMGQRAGAPAQKSAANAAGSFTGRAAREETPMQVATLGGRGQNASVPGSTRRSLSEFSTVQPGRRSNETVAAQESPETASRPRRRSTASANAPVHAATSTYLTTRPALGHSSPRRDPPPSPQTHSRSRPFDEERRTSGEFYGIADGTFAEAFNVALRYRQ